MPRTRPPYRRPSAPRRPIGAPAMLRDRALLPLLRRRASSSRSPIVRPNASLRAKVLALRHQLRVLEGDLEAWTAPPVRIGAGWPTGCAWARRTAGLRSSWQTTGAQEMSSGARAARTIWREYGWQS